MIPGFHHRKRFSELTEEEIVALAISSEEEDGRIYATYAEKLRADYPESAGIFDGMAAEEDEHRRLLIERFRVRFGETIPVIRREHVSGFYHRRPYWLISQLGLDRVRKEAEAMEEDAANFYTRAAQRTKDAETRKLLGDLAAAEAGHVQKAEALEGTSLTTDRRSTEDALAHRRFVMTYVQPGLAGLMDGSVSTLAPVFAAAFATQNTWNTFLVGLAAAIGAGISMGFTEALSDDGALTGRGSPLARGISCGLMTAIGGLGHALPYLIPQFWTATGLAFIVVIFELVAIAWIRWRFMETPFFRAAFQIIVGGALVFAVGILIGSA
ncbi:Rubrerythrin [Faunimonas pinastri]|uniref:Rubrerythrin n=1 Tax=Faunimonas pinastri TaxID=1855383 RepID=A0A1H9GQS6_9HYPH|nr:ferritin family protein [Faunimonas pinastri]SEQ52329.1 Rubrerythrin [Faunimonas pinastri]